MQIESSPSKFDSSPTVKLVARAREKYIQRQQQGGKQAVAQAILSPTYDLSVVVPTRNEHDNIWPLVEAVHHALHDLRVEVIFVDDSDDDTPEVIKDAAKTMSSSCYIKGGSYQGLDGVGRRCISVGLKWTAKLLFPGQLLRLSDPLGGFFLLRRSLLADVSLRPIGYKILLEILIRCQWRHVLEVPYHFRTRAHGQSKANMRQGRLALQHMLRLWREVPAAGRVWKISILILLNVLITLALFQKLIVEFFLPRRLRFPFQIDRGGYD